MNQNIFKFISVFLLGAILGYLTATINIPSTVQVTEAGTINKVLGKENAPVTMVEYSDFECPLCKRYQDQSFETIKTEYIDTGKVKYVFKHYPLEQIHPKAKAAGNAANCAAEQDKFWEYHDLLFQNQSEWARSNNQNEVFFNLAQELNINNDRFKDCVEQEKYFQDVENDLNEGRKEGVSGTPTFIINGQKIVGAQPTDVLINAIEEELSN